MNQRICTSCQSHFDPKYSNFSIWFTFVLGFFFLWPIWIWTFVLVKRRTACTACGAWKTLDLSTAAGKAYAKRFDGAPVGVRQG